MIGHCGYPEQPRPRRSTTERRHPLALWPSCDVISERTTRRPPANPRRTAPHLWSKLLHPCPANPRTRVRVLAVACIYLSIWPSIYLLLSIYLSAHLLSYVHTLPIYPLHQYALSVRNNTSATTTRLTHSTKGLTSQKVCQSTYSGPIGLSRGRAVTCFNMENTVSNSIFGTNHCT